MLSHFTPEKTSPLIYITMAITIAIYIQHILILPSYLLYLLFCSSFFIFGYNQNTATAPHKNIFFISALFCLMLCITDYQQKDHSTIHAKLTNKKISIRGTISDIESHHHTKLPLYIRIKIDDYSENNSAWQPLQTSIVIYTQNNFNLMVGDYIIVNNIKSPQAQDSFKNYLMYHSIGAYFFCPYFHHTLQERPSFSLKRMIHTIKRNLSLSLEKKLSNQTFCLFSTLFLGEKMKHIDPNQTFPDQFRQWGISHLLARSGAHLALFIYLYFLLICIIPLPLLIKQFFCAILCILYFLLSFSSTPFLRALFSILLFFYCSVIKRPAQSLHLTLCVYNLFLLTNPISLFFLDFQLSFLFTISLSWLSKKIYAHKNID